MEADQHTEKGNGYALVSYPKTTTKQRPMSTQEILQRIREARVPINEPIVVRIQSLQPPLLIVPVNKANNFANVRGVEVQGDMFMLEVPGSNVYYLTKHYLLRLDHPVANHS